MDRSSERHRDKREPTEYSVLCSLHIELSCFTADTILTQSLGLGEKKATLKPGAVTTLFTKQATSKRKLEMDQPLSKKRRSVYEKHECCRVSHNLPITIASSYVANFSMQCMEQAKGVEQALKPGKWRILFHWMIYRWWSSGFK